MAATLELVKRADIGSDQSTLNLISAASTGITLRRHGWIPSGFVSIDELIDEAMNVKVVGTSHNNLATFTQSLAAYKRDAKRYINDPAERYGVWLRWKLDDETVIRQTLVHQIIHKPVDSPFSRTTLTDNSFANYQVGITRNPLWEESTNISITDATLECCAGITAVYSEVYGDQDARISRVNVYGVSGANIVVETFWLGIRSDRFGTPANFKHYWSCCDASIEGTDYSESGDDGTTKDNGHYVIITFGTTGMSERFRVAVGDVTANASDQRGTFLVLLRAKLSGAGEARARLISGLKYGDVQKYDRVSIDSTSWFFYEMGVVTLPTTGRLYGGSALLEASALGIEAEWVSGAGPVELHCDILALIPLEGFAWATGAEIEYQDIGDQRRAEILNRPDGKINAIGYRDGTTPHRVIEGDIDGGIPPGTGVMVFCAQGASVQHEDDTCYVSAQGYPRWEMMGGAET